GVEPALAPMTQPVVGDRKSTAVALNSPVTGRAGPSRPPLVATRICRGPAAVPSGVKVANTAVSALMALMGAGLVPPAGAETVCGPAWGSFITGVHRPAAVPR